MAGIGGTAPLRVMRVAARTVCVWPTTRSSTRGVQRSFELHAATAFAATLSVSHTLLLSLLPPARRSSVLLVHLRRV
jgi:hypothetical protein